MSKEKPFDINEHVTSYICGYCAKKYPSFEEAKACLDGDRLACKMKGFFDEHAMVQKEEIEEKHFQEENDWYWEDDGLFADDDDWIPDIDDDWLDEDW